MAGCGSSSALSYCTRDSTSSYCATLPSPDTRSSPAPASYVQLSGVPVVSVSSSSSSPTCPSSLRSTTHAPDSVALSTSSSCRWLADTAATAPASSTNTPSYPLPARSVSRSRMGASLTLVNVT